MALINLLDPFSFFGRTVTHLLQPLTVWIFNASSDILKHFGVYAFVKKLHYIPLSVLAATFVFILLLLIMSLRQGRLYCNTICPVGALLGMISRVAFFQLAINRTDCNACGRCESVCKAGCIDMAKAQIDQDRCVSCFNCLDACPQSLISYRPFSGGAGPHEWSPARRGFLIGSAAAAGSIFWLTNSALYSLIGADRKENTLPVTPPGSAGLQHFTATCTACHLCVAACPTKVITPAFLEYGIAGLMQPMMNYRESYCDYECNTCGKVCPTGAIKLLLLPEKKFVQIGISELIKDKCVVYVNDENCGACGEVCPTHTISFVNKNDILYPETDNQYCIGCGACEKACPTTPKSIIVKSNPIHKKAVKFVAPITDIKSRKQSDKDFPF
jgi:ferredoxin